MKMYTDRKIAIIAGVLFITATVAGILSSVFTGPILGNPDYLIKISTNENQVIIGALFTLVMGFAGAGIAISLYPILRKYNEGLALGSVGFRIIEGMLWIINAIGLLLLLTLSKEFVKAGTPGSSSFQTSAILIRAAGDWVSNVVVLLAWCLGALMYYYIFYQTKLIPRWLAAWGLIGIILTLIACGLVLFRLINSWSTIQIVLFLPIALQEMFLAVWLIVKGFNSSALLPEYSIKK
jgi:hypothetical protein